jgi:hypothetical protein
MEKYQKYIRWGLLGALTAGLLYQAVIKLSGKEVALLVSWGFPAWSVYLIGGLQLLGALGLFYRSTVKISLFFLTTIVIGAILTLAGKHLFYPDLFYPIAFLLGLFGLMYLKAKRPDDEEGRWGLL